MYVCVCNAVTEEDVHSCLAAGATSAKEVRAACGMRPGCGSCTRRIFSMVSDGNFALAGEQNAAAESSDDVAA